MSTNRYRCVTAAALCAFFLVGLLSPSHAARQTVNPHWTGRHCIECHVEKNKPGLKFQGNVQQLCTRCHGDAPPACTKVHPGRNAATGRGNMNIPAGWPLSGTKTTCLTCHAARLQMHRNAAAHKANENFLRDYVPGDLPGFCLACHSRQEFQKVNPHQGSLSGKDTFCHRCHTDDLATGFDAGFGASVKTDSPTLCLGCHWYLPKAHSVHERLEPARLSTYEATLHALEDRGIELPLANGRMHCATCHNPHPPGIIGRRAAAIGAGEEHFLRIPDAPELCGVCHPAETVDDYLRRFGHIKPETTP